MKQIICWLLGLIYIAYDIESQINVAAVFFCKFRILYFVSEEKSSQFHSAIIQKYAETFV